MPKLKEGHRIAYDVHPTPTADGKQTTYHVRRISQTLSGRYLRDHIGKTSIISSEIFELVMENLRKEIPEQLLKGFDIHIEGLGTFYLKIGTKAKGYTDPKAITANQLRIEGIGFTADKEFNKRVRTAHVYFDRDEHWQSKTIDEHQMVATLTDYCRHNGYFTIHTLMGLFHLTKYKASLIANQLVSGDFPKFIRQREGTSYIYKRIGV